MRFFKRFVFCYYSFFFNVFFKKIFIRNSLKCLNCINLFVINRNFDAFAANENVFKNLIKFIFRLFALIHIFFSVFRIQNISAMYDESFVFCIRKNIWTKKSR